MKMVRIEASEKQKEKISCKTFIYNSETGEYLGRNCLSWTQIGVYYLAFYSCLITLFSGLLIIFLQSLSEEHPYFEGEESIIGSTPGVHFFPMPPRNNLDSDLIWFKPGKDGNWKYYALETEKATKEYDKGEDSAVLDCEDGGVKPSEGESCEFVLDEVEDCNKNNAFGYESGQPCIFLRLNRIYRWRPLVYSKETLPKKAPGSFKDLSPKSRAGLVYVECNGVYPEDKINLGPVKYYPEQGFPAYYFPYLKQKDYLNPLVAVQFVNPMKDTLINIRCNLWAKNIKHDERNRIGGLRFSLIIDS